MVRRKIPFTQRPPSSSSLKKAKYETYTGIEQPSGTPLTRKEASALEEKLRNERLRDEALMRPPLPPLMAEKKPFWDRATRQQVDHRKKQGRVLRDPQSTSVATGKPRHGNIPKHALQWYEIQKHNNSYTAPAWITVDTATTLLKATKRCNVEEVRGGRSRVMLYIRDEGYRDMFQIVSFNRATGSWSTINNHPEKPEAVALAENYTAKGLHVKVLHHPGR